ncbi:MAG: cell division protein FtsQ/DivIB, partial [Rothia dentocariosa]
VDVGQEAPQDSAAFRTVANVLSALPSSILTQVKEARASSTSNINLTLKDGVVVQWGTAEESDLKAKVLTKLMEAVREDQSKTAQQGQAANKVNTYDVSSPRVPVTR